MISDYMSIESGTEEQGRLGWAIAHPLFGKKWLYFCWQSFENKLVLSRLKEKLKLESLKGETKTIYIEALDFEVDFIDIRFNQPNFKAYE